MGLLSSISSVLVIGLASGPAGLVWSWFIAGCFIFSEGTSMSFLSSAIPTSGGILNTVTTIALILFESLWATWLLVSSLGLLGGHCSINYGFAVEVLSAVSISRDNTFEFINCKRYGIFCACVTLNIISCLTTRHAAKFQTLSIIVNMFLVILFIIVVPIGFSRNNSFNAASYMFANFENTRDWPTGWSTIVSFQTAIWTIGAFDSVIRCSEEALNAQRSIPYGILGSIGACWWYGWFIMFVWAGCIKDADVGRVLAFETGSPMAQIILNALGKRWAVAFMAMIAVVQYYMAISIMISLSRQIWSFARDDGLLVVYRYVKYIDPKISSS